MSENEWTAVPMTDHARWTRLENANVTHLNHFDNPYFTRHDDGRITVDRWSPEILITDDLLEAAEADLMHCDGEFLEIHVANGAARYWLAGVATGGQNVFKLLESVLDPEDGAVCGNCFHSWSEHDAIKSGCLARLDSNQPCTCGLERMPFLYRPPMASEPKESK